MGKVTSISLAGLQMWFWSHDHEPWHFHVTKTDEWEIRVYFMACTAESGLKYDLKWGRHPDSKILKRLNGLVLLHQLDLLTEWENKVF